MSSNDRHAGSFSLHFANCAHVGADIFQIVGADTQVCPDDDDININDDIMELSNGIPVGADLCVCPDMVSAPAAPCCAMVQNNDNQ